MMQVRSGLTGIQVKQKQFTQRHAARILAPAFQLQPVLLLGAGLGFLSDAWFNAAWLGFALATLIFGASMAVHAAFKRWLMQFNAPQSVLVVRDGLLRAIDAQALVAGDLVQVRAGQLLPVDVLTDAATVTTSWLRVVLALTGRQVPTGVALAGSRVLHDARVEVLAIADNRFIATDAQTLFAAPVLTRPTLAAGLGMLRAAALTWFSQVQTQVLRQHTARPLLATALVPVRRLIATPTTQVRRALVAPMRHSAKEAAFRYNQDPVSWLWA
ncbi:hypothetical protein [Lacticaseibacillus absianus]|uniref:hypothetical protein n=1 Tax=Lacticaseibacillus absianus TaxID=2729623 RepID=UPI0015C75ABB|nr:hypothetical protein [Lacticaseibacillus absianus]